MKVQITSKGIKDAVMYNVRDAKSNLNSAKNNIPTAPANFQYASFVESLTTKISGYIKENTYIYNSIQKVEKAYLQSFEDKIEEIDKVVEKTFKERSGLKDITLE